MIEAARHVPLRAPDWDESTALAAIDGMVSDTLSHFDEEAFWPAPPFDDAKGGHRSRLPTRQTPQRTGNWTR